ncbi:MAG: hypothetical protein IJ973_03430 [Christensenellaceae bacterium]|nr:hypothetical protein [Christensenellaceae bacterium]
MMNRTYEKNTSCAACAPSVRAASCCAHAAMQSSSNIILILDAIILASIIISALLLGEICLALLPVVILSLRLARRRTDMPRKRMFA